MHGILQDLKKVQVRSLAGLVFGQSGGCIGEHRALWAYDGLCVWRNRGLGKAGLRGIGSKAWD